MRQHPIHHESLPIVILLTFKVPSFRLGVFFSFLFVKLFIFSLLFAETANLHAPKEEGGRTTPEWVRAAQLKAGDNWSMEF